MASHTSPVPKAKRFISVLGAGLITGAADDDPSGIVTYSQAGAQFGYGMLWTLLLSLPFMCAIQEISGRIGRVTGHGIAANVRRHYSRGLLYGIVFLLFIANTINLGADLGAMGAALHVATGGSTLVYVALFALVSILIEVFIPYKKYVFYLRWLTFALFAYVIAASTVKVQWREALKGTFFQSISWNFNTLVALTAILGTTISPYLFFWQASEEAEEVQDRTKEHALKQHPVEAPVQLRRIHRDTYTGMAFSNIVAFFIMLTTAAALHAHGIRTIDTAVQAASALEPLAGRFAFLLFTLGIVGTGLLAIPVLAGSTAYAVGEALRWPVSLQRSPRRVKRFYAVLAVSVGAGVVLNFLPLNPIKALYWAAVLNGVASVPVVAMMMWMTSSRRVMGDFTIQRSLRVMGWGTFVLMLGAALGPLYECLRSLAKVR
jgi:NRAMP (natural resistance-associated macrophage protein)-like metal ion transporter